MQIRSSTIILIAGLPAALAAGHASAQDSQPADAALSSVELTEVEMGPQDVPGREQAPRTREEAKGEETPAPAAPDASDRSWFGGRPYWKWDYATGDWGGGRTWLMDRGINFQGSYTLHYGSVWDGGVRNGASMRTLFDVNATIDFDKLFGLQGGKLFADFYSVSDNNHLGDTGAIQLWNNIEVGRDVSELAELWYEQTLFGGVLRVKAGKIEANAEFGFVNAAGEFLNGSGAFSPNNAWLPTYPNPATGLVAYVYPTEQLYAGFGWFDGALQDGINTGSNGPKTFFSNDESSSWYYIGEVGFTWQEVASMGGGRVAGGIWHASGDRVRYDATTEDGTTGFYLLGEQQIWRRGTTDELAQKGLFLFGQYGYADENITAIQHHIAGGLTFKAPFESRASDSTGIYVSHAVLSGADGATFDGNETAVEAYYRIQLTPFFSIKPDIQYFFNPGGNNAIDDAIVGAVQLELVF
jgi:porin